MFSNTILSSWAGCPQSRLYHEVVAHGDRGAARLLTQVARQWDHTMAPPWLARAVPRRLRPAPFDAGAYRSLLDPVSLPALRQTMDHIGWLREQRRVRTSLASVAFLEGFEAAIAAEIERRERRLRRRDAARHAAAPRQEADAVAPAG